MSLLKGGRAIDMKQKGERPGEFILPRITYVLLFITALSYLPKMASGINIEFMSGMDVFI